MSTISHAYIAVCACMRVVRMLYHSTQYIVYHHSVSHLVYGENCNFDSFSHIYIQHARLLLAKVRTNESESESERGCEWVSGTVLRNNRASNQHMIRVRWMFSCSFVHSHAKYTLQWQQQGAPQFHFISFHFMRFCVRLFKCHIVIWLVVMDSISIAFYLILCVAYHNNERILFFSFLLQLTFNDI